VASADYKKYSYDADQNILSLRHPDPVDLATRADIVGYFDRARAFWVQNCKPRKVYALVDYANLTMNLDELDAYADQVKRMLRECAITIVRYDGTMVQRMAGRMTAIRLHVPSNTYATREEALHVIRGLKLGTVKLPSPDS
jgi:hypothetical protein